MSLSAAARLRYTLVAGSTAVVIGAGFISAGILSGSSDTPVPQSADAPLAAAATPSGGAADPLPAGDLAPSSAAPSPTAGKKSSPTPRATVSKKTVTTPPTRKTSSKRTTAAVPEGTTVPVTSDDILDQVLAHINAARAGAGLPALTLDAQLSKASALHNQLMIDGCGLSHQCSGEGDIGKRFSAQGVSWSSAGENIGYGSSGSSATAKVKAANGLTDSMLAEVPPNDGHRRNLLSKSFTRIGLSVVRDSKGITWMTQDFVG
ncbi:CAP domain-containing protein [Actinoplanes oblitus]|uniref:CAP domain-containing protein n=1 Tax=Actinoplanes oblitus TaxID=3040509 RepID=A0ABY8WAT8_9ACTN|nr:CAP domain-containing protein [Actinoplanes oblitus]WIM94612.1 CAP domain-containing protein [Actinoplanes oblitus]